MPAAFSMDNLTISLCLATHERAFLLAPTLEKIAQQTRLPDEIIVSDSSLSADTRQVVEAFKNKYPHLSVQYHHTDCKALPWHRWNGFQHSTGQIVFFMDDDIALAPDALQMLEKAYLELFEHYGAEEVAGVGFYTFLDDGSEKLRRPNSFEERWLGIANVPSASITPGGTGVHPKSMPKNTLVEVGRLSGGMMSFRREVLEQVGRLEHLIALFERGIGPSEDTVLCHYAHRYGSLFMLTYPLLTHPNDERAVHTVDARNGWRRGLTETWGRAHTMRWMASDLKAYRREWLRVATLEVLRSIWWGILRRPFSPQSWSRLAGALFGIGLTFVKGGQIPPLARSMERHC